MVVGSLIFCLVLVCRPFKKHESVPLLCFSTEQGSDLRAVCRPFSTRHVVTQLKDMRSRDEAMCLLLPCPIWQSLKVYREAEHLRHVIGEQCHTCSLENLKWDCSNVLSREVVVTWGATQGPKHVNIYARLSENASDA